MNSRFLALAWAFLAASTSVASADGIAAQGSSAGADACCDIKWTGFYGAALIGYGVAGTDVGYGYADEQVDPPLSTTFSERADGVTGAIAVGYDRLLDNRLLLGVFGEYAFGDLDTSRSLPLDDRISLSFDDTWSVGGRVGFVRCCTLFYATAGYTSTEATMTTFLHDESDRLDGYFVGAGLEHYLDRGFFLRAEYRYSDFEDASTYVTFACDCDEGFERIDRDHDLHTFQVGLVYKFGRDEPAPAPLK